MGAWINEAISILEQHGYSASKLNSADLRLIILHESGGNPNAVNNWDSNARAGNPSMGLCQVVATTLRANTLDGYDDPLNPVDSIVGATEYARHRYGSLSAVPGVQSVHSGGHYRGY